MKFTFSMCALPVDSKVRCIVFGKSGSGKTRFALNYASQVLLSSDNDDSIALVIARRSKAERKPPPAELGGVLSRIFYKWADDDISLIKIASNLHVFSDKPLALLIVEDILEFVPVRAANAAISLFLNALEAFKNCRFIVTMTPRQEANIVNFRRSMTHYANTYSDAVKVGVFPKNLAKATTLVRNFMEQ